MNILFPMAGMGERMKGYQNNVPKPLISLLGKSIIEWAISSLGLDGKFIFCCKSEHLEKYDIEKKLRKIIPNCEIVKISYQTKGPVETILEAISLINNDEELVISDSDHYLLWDYQKFNNQIRKSKIDACVMVYPDEQISDKLSYVKLNDDGYVVEAAEKNPISKIATVGLHYYKKGSDFVRHANNMIKKNNRVKNEFYVTPVYNEYLSENKKIITFPVTKMWSLGTPDEVEIFKNSQK